MDIRDGEVWIHIGRHKTGTSSIQWALSLLGDGLDEGGFRYAKTGRESGAIAHHAIAQACHELDLEALAHFRAELNEELKTAKILILSSEAFQNLLDPTPLFSLFPPGVTTRVIVYLREVVDYATSSYAQRIQNSDLAQVFDEYVGGWTLNYRQFVETWSSFSETIEVRLYDRDRLVGGDAVSDFLSLLFGPSINKFPVRLERNPSIGGNLLFIKFALNRAKIPLNRSTAYRSLAAVAEDTERFPVGFWIDEAVVKRVRATNSSNGQYLAERFGAVGDESFSTRPLAPNLETLAEDVALLATMPGLQPVIKLLSIDRTNPKFQLGELRNGD